MFVARDQENLVARHQTGAVLKQQQNSQLGSRYPKTPIKIPLNDENAGHMKGGAKSILGNRTRGNENATTSKGLKGVDKSNFVTPMEPRVRAALGDKTTNAKAKGQQTVNVKSAVRELEKTQAKAPNTNRPKQKQPQAETQKLQIHAEALDPLSEEEPEYCPPRPKDLPYESDVFPDGVLTFDALKPENMFKGFHQFYFNPVDEDGVSKQDKELQQRIQKAMEEGERQIQEDMDSFEWGSLQRELDAPKTTQVTAPAAEPVKARSIRPTQTMRKPLGSVTSRTAASALAMNDATKSMQRKSAKAVPAPISRTKATSFAIPVFKPRPAVPQSTAVKRTPMANIEANSRTTLGYNKGRAAASVLARKTTTTRPAAKPSQTLYKPKASGLPRSETTSSTDSDKTITPARFASKNVFAEAEDQEWKERVPFLSIFNPEDDDGCDLAGGPLPDLEDDDDFELQVPE
ncbi:hypothetical protein JX265_004186 [Neoarthrinium moseri]|uniref:Uncharacterized protein n=1 Tax=Neoarthrinium moseri TaxID=1658444 RepID=A0A9P9WRQ2_9PEZI|nr:hypothetical protein JX265_004186 [Neoarthrinium moseri]